MEKIWIMFTQLLVLCCRLHAVEKVNIVPFVWKGQIVGLAFYYINLMLDKT